MEKIIDLNLVGYLRDERIIKYIKENISDYEIIIIPISILNSIECSKHYTYDTIEKSNDVVDGYYYVGTFLGKKVVIDITILENIAILSYNNQTKREMKLNSLINNKPIKEDLKIKFISYI